MKGSTYMTTSTVVILVTQILVSGVEPGTVQVAGMSGSTVWLTTVTPDRLARTPEWKDGDKDPPFSPLKALNLAEAKRKELVKDSDDWVWELSTTSTTRIKGDRWYYEVHFHAEFQGGASTGSPPGLVLIVLMDGTIPEPVVWERGKFFQALSAGAFDVGPPLQQKTSKSK